MNITGQTLDLLQYAIKQASNSSRCSNPDDRLISATNMLKRKRYNFLTLKLDDDKEKGIEDNDETTSNILSVPTITDQQFIQTMNDRGEIKRELENNENLSNTKKSRITTNDRPEQVIQNLKNHINFIFNLFLSHQIIPNHPVVIGIQLVDQLLCVRMLFITVYH